MDTSTNITAQLVQWGDGDAEIMNEVYPLIEPELKRVARSMIRRFEPGDTLQPTALINETYIRLVDQKRRSWKNRSHFFAISAMTMKRVVMNHIRRGGQKKRWGEVVRVSMSEASAVAFQRKDELLALDEALAKLESVDEKKAAIATMRYFGGMTVPEVAEVLDVAPITVMREWKMAKAWLNRELGDAE